MSRERMDIVSTIPRPAGNGEIRIGSWIEGAHGALIRFSTVPPGITIKDAERIVAQPGWKPTAPQPEPIRPPLKPEW